MYDTIFAPATPLGGAVCVIRVSGENAAAVLRAVFTNAEKAVDAPRSLIRGSTLSDGRQADDALAAFFPAPRSYTGEDMAELHAHGSPAVVALTLEALSRAGARLAEPGEFTRRAFLNGKLDLMQAEAVMDLINASAQSSARNALLQMRGALSAEVTHIQQLLVNALASLEAVLDYPVELEDDVNAGLLPTLRSAKAEIQALLATRARGRVLREGFRVALVGLPNAGKSSLLNALLGFGRAIVSSEPGTTRDTIEESVVLGGALVRLTDTAGLRAASSEAEILGISRTKAAMEEHDLLLVLLDRSEPMAGDSEALLAETAGYERIIVLTKSDLPPALSIDGAIDVSALTGFGLAGLTAAIRAKIPALEADNPAISKQRVIDALERADELLSEAISSVPLGLECAALPLREALRLIGTLTGDTVDEEVLEAIFSTFCLGK